MGLRTVFFRCRPFRFLLSDRAHSVILRGAWPCSPRKAARSPSFVTGWMKPLPIRPAGAGESATVLAVQDGLHIVLASARRSLRACAASSIAPGAACRYVPSAARAPDGCVLKADRQVLGGEIRTADVPSESAVTCRAMNQLSFGPALAMSSPSCVQQPLAVSVRPCHLDGRPAAGGVRQEAADQRCGRSSSMRLAGWVGSRSSTSRMYA